MSYNSDNILPVLSRVVLAMIPTERSTPCAELAHTLRRVATLSVVEAPVDADIVIGATCVPLQTNGNGACSVHAVWGQASLARDGSWELMCADGRARIGKLLGNDCRSLEQKLDDKRYLHAIVSSLWSELFVPSSQPGASSESRAFAASLKQRNESLFQKARAFMSDAQTESAENID